MSKRKGTRPRLFWLLLLTVLVSLALTPPAEQTRASLCDPPPAGCIELTVWNPQTCQCECPDQACCEFYYPFTPHGCPGNPGEKSVSVAQLKLGR
jgi:CXCXC repeat